MKVAIKKLNVADIGNLQALVIDNIQGIEPGLTVLDSRLLLGHATIDLVAMDVHASLVLVALGFSADEEMLLKAVEAYSWCLEYPEAIRRLYPAAQISERRPPRLIFVVGRVPDAFQRKVKQLGFSEVDCVEFRHLEVDGTPVLYFETVVQLRRPTLGMIDARATAPPPTLLGGSSAHVNGFHDVRPAQPVRDVVAPAPPERPTPAVELTPTVAPAPPERPAPAVELTPTVVAPALAGPETELQAAMAPAAEPVTAIPAPVAAAPAPDEVPSPVAMPALDPLAALLEQMTLTGPTSPMIEPLPATESAEPAVAMPTLEAPELVVEQGAREPLPAPEPAGASLAVAAKELLGAKSIEEAARAAFAAATPSFADRQPTSAAPAAPAAPAVPAAVPPAPAADKAQVEPEPAKPAPPLPQEFAGLNFPNDGVLTRQWMEFLNRMANSK